MNKNPVGRPITSGVTKTGKPFILWLHPQEIAFLDEIVKTTGLTKASFLRGLLREKMIAR